MNGETLKWMRRLARMQGVAPFYQDYKGRMVQADAQTLRILTGCVANDPIDEGISAAHLRERVDALRRHRRERGAPAVLVAWDGKLQPFWLWAEMEGEIITLTLRAEQSQKTIWVWERTGAESIARSEGWKRVRVADFEDIPLGYYTLEVRINGLVRGSSFLIAAPVRPPPEEKGWGVFVPAYGLRSARSAGMGDFTDLRNVAQFIRREGGRLLGTLPLLPGSYENADGQISPYSPASRLFWNEIFLDMDDLPGFEEGGTVEDSESAALVDYGAVYARKKPVLMRAAERFFAAGGAEDEDYRAFCAASPWLEAYADYRAFDAPDRDAARRYHLYAQYACHRQLGRFKALADEGRAADLYLDYPVGVDAQSFDVFEFPAYFIKECHVGAPPDMFFSHGQDWGFYPLHPRTLEADHFTYIRATLHHFFSYARILRLDHIMGFYRIYCIPAGQGAETGTYIRYLFAAFLAVLCLEMHRHGGIVIGEDLGTVPAVVRAEMEKHHFLRSWIFQFEIDARPERSFKNIAPAMLAAFNTHDMFPFQAFLKGYDIDRLAALELLAPEEAGALRRERDIILKSWRRKKDAFMDALEGMARSDAQLVLVNMEDLWDEEEPQNIPGTVDQYPNWRRKLRLAVEQWQDSPRIKQAFSMLNKHRGHK